MAPRWGCPATPFPAPQAGFFIAPLGFLDEKPDIRIMLSLPFRAFSLVSKITNLGGQGMVF
jgi:hypothetical protein